MGCLLVAGCSSGSSGGSDAGASSSPSASGGVHVQRGGRLDGVRTYPDLPAGQHTDGPVDYPQSPPVGGPHNPVWAPCDGVVYDVPLGNEHAVHSLEHGAVWITHKPGLPAAQLTALKALVDGQDYMMMSPYPTQSSPITLTAWGAQLDVTSPDDPRIAAFIEAYRSGLTTPERGASCAAVPGGMAAATTTPGG